MGTNYPRSRREAAVGRVSDGALTKPSLKERDQRLIQLLQEVYALGVGQAPLGALIGDPAGDRALVRLGNALLFAPGCDCGRTAGLRQVARVEARGILTLGAPQLLVDRCGVDVGRHQILGREAAAFATEDDDATSVDAGADQVRSIIHTAVISIDQVGDLVAFQVDACDRFLACLGRARGDLERHVREPGHFAAASVEG